jgi:hypothetical protein
MKIVTLAVGTNTTEFPHLSPVYDLNQNFVGFFGCYSHNTQPKYTTDPAYKNFKYLNISLNTFDAVNVRLCSLREIPIIYKTLGTACKMWVD